MSIGFKNITKCQIKEGISAAATTILLQNTADYVPFVASPGTYVYAVLRDHQNFEIIKINVAASTVNGLSAARGQEGTVARAWIRGTILYQDITAASLGDFQQKGIYRTVAYNPNGVLSPAYAGEKVYQDDATACKKRWWKSFDAANPYWALIAGTICDGESIVYPDDFDWGVIMGWTSMFDDSYWQINSLFPLGSWDGSKYIAELFDGIYYINLETVGDEWTDFFPSTSKPEFSVSEIIAEGRPFALSDSLWGLIGQASLSCLSEQEITLNFIGNGDIRYLQLSHTSTFNLTGLQFKL